MTTTKYITWSGGPTGDYTCDGTNDEVEINSAFTWANSNPNNIIKMRGTGDSSSPHKYHIANQIKICSYVTWTAETGACLWVPDNACGSTISDCVFPNGTPVIGQLGSYIVKVEIYGFEIDGNCQNQSTVLGKAHGVIQSAGSGVERLIQLRGLSGSQTKASEIYIHDMNFHDAFGEAVHIRYAKSVRVIGIGASNHQHDCVYFGEVSGDDNELSECMLYGITDSTIRLDNCQNVPVHDNYIYSYDGSNNNGATLYGHNGMQIANNSGTYFTLHTNNISVYNNYFTGKNLCGIWLNDTMKTSGSTAQNVHIYNNSFELEIGWADWASWASGISIAAWGNGVIIENNVFDGCYANSVQISSAIPSSSTHTVTIRNNNIINTMGMRSGSSGGPSVQGWGIWNAIPTKFVVKAENNFMTGNLAGNYKGLTPSSESDTSISNAGPYGGSSEDDSDDTVTPVSFSGFYIQSTSKIINTDFGYVQRAEDDFHAYINGVPFDIVSYNGSGSKAFSESHSPSAPGTNLGDLDLKGSELQLSCIAESIDEIDQVMAAFAQRGRSFLELGGPYKGYFVSGIMPDHGSSYDKGQSDIPEEYLDYSVSFKTEFPYREWMFKTIRGRYVSTSCIFSSCDIHNGNLIRNPNFSSWTPDHNLQWKMIKRDAVDNQWQKVKYSPELKQWCACAKTGSNNRIMVSGPQLVTDLSGDYNTGIYTGDVSVITGGLAFGGTDGYVDIPVPGIANATDWTIYSKMSTTSTSGTQTIFGLGRSNSDTPLVVLWIKKGNIAFWHRDDSGATANITGGNVADGIVHEICIVKSGTVYTLYVDNVQAGTTTASLGTTSPNGANIGRIPRSSNLYCFNGNIYSTRIFSRALASNEVPYAYAGTTGLLQAYSTVITDDPGEFWAIPPDVARLSDPDLSWTGEVWCPDWHLWVVISSSQSGSDCIISPDGVNWTQKSTPLDRKWSNCVFIPANETLPNGRLIVFAKSGTGSLTMYSDDQCETWAEVDIPADVATNIIQASVYSPEHSRVVIVTSAGSATKRVIYTDDYGVTYNSVTAPAQKWIGITWANLLGLFVSCSIDGEQQIMTSPTGLEGTWALQDTPYAYSTVSPGSSIVVKALTDVTETGWNYTTLATSYTDKVNPMKEFTIPAPGAGNHIRIDRVRARLRAVSTGSTAYLKVTAKTATIPETIIKEWTETAITYQQKGYECAFEGAAGEAVTLTFYLRSSSASVRAGADNMGYTASEMTAGPSSITYYRNQWRDIAYSQDLNLAVVVCQDTANVNYVMYSSTGTNWYQTEAIARQGWVSVEYSDNQKAFISVANSGTNRVQFSEGYGDLINLPPSLWTKVTDGEEASDLYTHDSDRSLLLKGDGVTENPGYIYQKLPFDSLYDAGELYIMLAYAHLEGLTHGSYHVDLYAGGTIIKELVWNADTEDTTPKEIRFRFDQIPSSVYIRVRGADTPNKGSLFYCGYTLVSKVSEYENEDVGAEITTDGYYDCVPNVKLRGIGTTTSSGTSDRIIEDTDSQVYYTESTNYKLVKTVTLPALTGGSKYQLNVLSYNFKTDSTSGYVYAKVTLQADSLFSGAETDIALYTTNYTDYQTRKYDLPYELYSDTGETVTLRWYIKISKTGVTAFLTNTYYKLTEILDSMVTKGTPIYIYNNADTRKRLQICNDLPPGFLVEINKDGTGAIRYNEPFEDDRYVSNAYKITGAVARDTKNQTLKMPASSSYEILIDSLYAVSGVPFIKLHVVSGIPQISIAADVSGEPGTYYTVDSNTSDALDDVDIVRQLDNETNQRLRSLNKFYVKIEPLSGESCVFGQMLIYSFLDTSDAQRINIYAAEKPNEIGVYVGGEGKCSAILSLEYRKTNMIQ